MKGRCIMYQRKPHSPGIGIDIDGVISDTATRIIEIANVRYDLNIKYDDITRYALHTCTPLTEEQVESIISNPFAFQGTMPLPGAKDALDEISMNYTIHLITARRVELQRPTLKWLDEFEIPYYVVKHTEEKEKYAEDHQLEIFIEDSHENALKLAKVVQTVFLIDHPWNREDTPGNVIRVGGWDQILDVMEWQRQTGERIWINYP